MSATDIEGLTSKNYKVPQGEENVYHCKVEIVEFNKKTGKKMSRPRIQKFGKKIFESVVYDSLLKQGYTVEVLYNPTEYLKQRMAQGKTNAAEQKKAEKEKMKAEIIAELQAAGIIPADGGKSGKGGKGGKGKADNQDGENAE